MKDSYINHFNRLTQDQRDSELAAIARVEWHLSEAHKSLLFAERLASKHRFFDFQDMTNLHELVTSVETAMGDLFNSEAVIQSMRDRQLD